MKEKVQQIHSLFQRWRVVRNDENYEKLYNATKDIIQRIAFIYSKSKDYSEEITQTIYIKIYNLETDELPRLNELNWLYSLTRSEVISYMEKIKEVKLEEIFEIPDGNNNFDEIIDKNKFNAMIYGIDYRQQEVIALRLIGEFSFEEISNMLDKKSSIVKWYYYKTLGTVKIGLISFALCLMTLVLYIQAKLTETDTTATVSNVKFFENTENSYLISFVFFLICTITCMIIFLKSQYKIKKHNNKQL
jgi:DNA-directed RNA polymerase specialized sigma24 family protein